jgi:hypothetical protein
VHKYQITVSGERRRVRHGCAKFGFMGSERARELLKDRQMMRYHHSLSQRRAPLSPEPKVRKTLDTTWLAFSTRVRIV